MHPSAPVSTIAIAAPLLSSVLGLCLSTVSLCLSTGFSCPHPSADPLFFFPRFSPKFSENFSSSSSSTNFCFSAASPRGGVVSFLRILSRKGVPLLSSPVRVMVSDPVWFSADSLISSSAPHRQLRAAVWRFRASSLARAAFRSGQSLA